MYFNNPSQIPRTLHKVRDTHMTSMGQQLLNNKYMMKYLISLYSCKSFWRLAWTFFDYYYSSVKITQIFTNIIAEVRGI